MRSEVRHQETIPHDPPGNCSHRDKHLLTISLILTCILHLESCILQAMRELSCDVLICGGGVGGCAAAMAACSLGQTVVMTDPCKWIGGQLTSQAVPPDEHPWIEEFGCTKTYRDFRNRIRAFYRDNRPLNETARANPLLNPGGGWVSWLCHEPWIAWQVLQEMLAPHVASGLLTILTHTTPTGAQVQGDRVTSVNFWSAKAETDLTITAKFFVDASELGDLLPLTKTEYVTGAESQMQTNERHAVMGDAQPNNIQGFTYVLALGWDSSEPHIIEKPNNYEKWRDYKPPFWPGPLLGWRVVGAHDGLEKDLPLINPSNHLYELLSYRQCIDPTIYEAGWPGHMATLVNWPQNDYFGRSIIDVNDEDDHKAWVEARELSLSLVYWMQTEAPRHDTGYGYSELYLRPEIMGTEDGMAQHVYVRESRRIRALFTVKEQHVSEQDNPGKDRAQQFYDSVGVGAYRIDLHPSTGGDNTIDFGSLPFQIPLGSIIPIRMKNLIPACKNIGTTHITNGCYRLHPVEWNIGEAVGALCAFCIKQHREPQQVHSSARLTEEFQQLLVNQGIEIAWPSTQLHAL
jgi:hypothetical protein